MRTLACLFLIAAAACAELKAAPAPEPAPPSDPAEPTTAVEPNAAAPTPSRSPHADHDASDASASSADAFADAAFPGAEKLDGLCSSYCSVIKRCHPEYEDASASFCFVSCYLKWRERAVHLRDDYVVYAEVCYETLACTESKNTCLTDWHAIESAPEDVPVVSACMAASKTCGLLQKDDCYDFLAFDEPTRAAVTECFSSEKCIDLQLCFDRARGH